MSTIAVDAEARNMFLAVGSGLWQRARRTRTLGPVRRLMEAVATSLAATASSRPAVGDISPWQHQPMEPVPPELFLDGYPPAIQDVADRLRAIVRRAVPDSIERVRTGWRLIGYDVPAGRRSRYFAFVAPEPGHVHLGFEYGVWMTDPHGLLLGAHLELRKVRYVTFEPGDPIPEPELVEYAQEAARLATMSVAPTA
jgi:hypothetical protein